MCAAGASTHFPSWKWQGHRGKRWNSPGPPVMVNVVVSVFLFGELHIAVDGELQTIVENGISTFEGFWHQREKNWVLMKRISLEDEKILCRPFYAVSTWILQIFDFSCKKMSRRIGFPHLITWYQIKTSMSWESTPELPSGWPWPFTAEEPTH